MNHDCYCPFCGQNKYGVTITLSDSAGMSLQIYELETFIKETYELYGKSGYDYPCACDKCDKLATVLDFSHPEEG